MKTLVGLMACVLVAGCSGKREEPTKDVNPSPESNPVIETGDWWTAYQKNPIAADEMYKGKWVQIQGKVDQITSDSLGFGAQSGFSEISPARYNSMTALERKHFNDGYDPNLICEIDPAYRHTFRAAEKGKPFGLIGRVSGIKKGTDSIEGWTMFLKDCRGVPLENPWPKRAPKVP